MQDSYNNISLKNMHRLAATWENNTLSYFKDKLFGAEYEDKTSKYVTIFGSTQCGKTTLILTLIGVKDEYVFPLSKILRGSREFGKSSTATAVIYAQSPEDQFGFVELNRDEQFSEKENYGSYDISCKNEEEFKRQIDLYRNKMSAGEKVPFAVKYYIPNRFFEQSNELGNLVIIDLPGTEANGIERDYAKSVADKYRMLSDANIVVINSGEVQKLYDSGNEYLNHINDYGDICYFVTTRAITKFCANDKELAFPDGIFDGSVIKEYYKNLEVDKVRGRKLKEVVNADRIFPLEIGETKDNFIANNSTNSKYIADYINGEIFQLKQTILNSNSSSIFKYKNELKIHLNKTAARIEEIKATIDKYEKEYSIHKAQLDSISEGNNIREKQRCELENDKKKFNSAVSQVKKSLKAYKPRSEYKDTKNVKDNDYFKDRERIARIEENYCDFLKKYEENIRTKINNRIREITKNRVVEIDRKSLNFLDQPVDFEKSYINYDKCTLRSGFLKLNKEFSGYQIVNALRSRIENDTASLLAALKEYYDEYLDKMLKQYEDACNERLKDIENSNKLNSDHIQKLERKCSEEDNKLNEHKNNLLEVQGEFEEYLRYYDNFHSIVREFYDEEINRINDTLNDGSLSADKKFLLLLVASHMEKVFNNKVKE